MVPLDFSPSQLWARNQPHLCRLWRSIGKKYRNRRVLYTFVAQDVEKILPASGGPLQNCCAVLLLLLLLLLKEGEIIKFTDISLISAVKTLEVC